MRRDNFTPTLGRFTSFVFAATLATVLVACPSKKHGSEKSRGKTYFVKGDPMKLVSGAKLNPQSPFNLGNYQEFNGWGVQGVYEFVEREVSTSERTFDDYEGEQAPSDGSDNSLIPCQWQKVSDTEFSYQCLIFSLIFKLDNKGEFDLSYATNGSEKMSMDALHWSISADRSVISLLVAYKDRESGKSLSAIYFARDGFDGKVPKLDTRFRYEMGPGVRSGWNQSQPVLLDYCSSSDEHFKTLQAALSDWQMHLDGRLSIQLQRVSEYQPFTDLNQHCVYLVPNLLDEEAKNIATFGATISVFDFGTSSKIDADIFVFLEEFKKYIKALRSLGFSSQESAAKKDVAWSWTFKHELGHFLGLDHVFDGTSSIMAYGDDNEAQLQTYDIDAIQTLYPK